MDLSNFNLKERAERGFDLIIKDPSTGEDTDIIVTVVGSDSAQYRNAHIASYVEFPLDNDATTMQKADIVTKRKEFMFSACVTGWVGVEENGEAVEFTPENALRIVQSYPFFGDQVGEAVSDRENFA